MDSRRPVGPVGVWLKIELGQAAGVGLFLVPETQGQHCGGFHSGGPSIYARGPLGYMVFEPQPALRRKNLPCDRCVR